MSPELCGKCYLNGFCELRSAMVVSVETIRDPMARLVYQNWLVGLKISDERMIDFLVEALRDFRGGWKDDVGNPFHAPGIACILNPGAPDWIRDQREGGKWQSVDDVVDLRAEAKPRWALIGTVMGIVETNWPLCHPHRG